MRRILSLTILSLLLLTVAAIPASEYRLFGDPVAIVSGGFRVKDYTFPRAKPPTEPSFILFDDDGSSSWVAASGVGSCLWELVSGVLSPATAGESVTVTASGLTGALRGEATSGTAGVYGTTDYGWGVYGYASGNGWGGYFQAAGTNAGVAGISALGCGVEGIAYSESNTLYSIAAVDGTEPLACARTYLGHWADLYGVADPANPASGRVRIYAGTDGKAYCRDSAGTEYDLTATGGTMSAWTLAGDGGTPQTITDANTASILGGTGLTSAASATDTLTLNLDDTAVTPASYTYSSITVDQQGRLTAASSGATPAPVGAQYVTLAADATLTAERTFTAGNGITVVDAGANSTVTVAAPLTNGAGITCTTAGPGTGYTVASQAPWVTQGKAADENRTNNNTVANDGELVVALAASTTYAFRLKVYFDTTAIGDMQWKVAYSGTYVIWRMQHEWIVPGTTAKVDGFITAPTMLALVIAGTGTTGGYLEWDGIVQTTNAGNLSFQWAQNTKTADAGVTVYKGSYLEYQKIA